MPSAGWWAALMHVSQILLFVDIVSSYFIQPVHSGWVALERLYVVTAMLSFEELSSNICLHVGIVCILYGGYKWVTCLNNFLNGKALVGAFKQKKALVGAFSVIVKSSRTFFSSSSDESVGDTSLVWTVGGCP